MTTVADNEEGQSVFEFLLMLPVMIGLVVILVEVNSAIQVSIVDQQYARAAVTFYAFSSPIFPASDLRASQLDAKDYNQLMIGVMDNHASSEGSARPIASTQSILRRRDIASTGSNDPQAEPAQRSLVRVRNTVSLCSQSEVIQVNGQLKPILSSGGAYALPDNGPVDWQFCRAGIQMVSRSAQ